MKHTAVPTWLYLLPVLPPLVGIYVSHAAAHPLLRQSTGVLYSTVLVPLAELASALHARLHRRPPEPYPQREPRPPTPKPHAGDPVPPLALLLCVGAVCAYVLHGLARVGAGAGACGGRVCAALAGAAPATRLAWGLHALSGACFAATGFAAAHELRHRAGALRFAGWLYLALLLNPAYFADHAHHHRFVGTKRDTVSARRGDSAFAAIARMEAGAWVRAARLAECRLRARGGKALLDADAFAPGLAVSVAALGAVCALLGKSAGLCYATVALAGWVLMDSANYMQHYGLRRATDARTGKVEPVGPQHSWDCPCPVTNVLAFRAGAHSHHHLAPATPYQTLSTSVGPAYPLGIHCMTLIALCPPLFRAITHPILDRMEREGCGGD